MLTLEHIQAALALDATQFDPTEAHRRMAPSVRPIARSQDLAGQPRYAATMVLTFPIDKRLHFVLTRRPDTLTNHAGQISLPGGSKEPHEDYPQTARRETCEELGVCDPIEILGQLTRIYIPPSDFYVQPFVGMVNHHPKWQRDTAEVAEIIEAPLDILLDASIKEYGESEFNGIKFRHGWYNIQSHRVWGATAIMLSELEWRLRAVLPTSQRSASD